ncbi:uncharacterized protein LOC111349272 isoform X1 [Spodoptera litura]|uniref:Uncharacterized protein LOC111349272 isoform X1 n=1 Tax=Spodoptera litura TaxID=69820 RepID=A0A9J7II75_SPOLT|nr:uncharacterized protein LOC111349272 isoform X1 [Spodoptera litura]
MRAELVQARAASAASGCSGGCQESGDAAGNVTDAARARSEAAQLARENAALRETVLALHSELFGARLATKYLDKELAGRIQQLQLLGRDMRAELRDSLWAQVEAEILVQRHKTLVRVCRGAGAARACGRPAGAAPAARPLARTVRVRRSPHLGLGISVTGGREHGVPILISELEAGGPAALTGELYVGDAILAINDVDLTQACHKEAVQALQSVKGDCALCVQFIATDDDDRLSEDNYRFPLYPEDGEVFGGEQDGSGATPTAPRTPDYNRRTSDAGSGSECESEPYRAAPPPPANYPDYNNINNNLNILDMDDDSIKIEARLEWSGAEGAVVGAGRGVVGTGRAVVGAGRAASSAESAASTPVHARPNALKKKRKPQDWRTKGAYRPVELEAPSSDEPLTEAPCDNLPVSDGVPESPIAPVPPPQIVQPLIDIEPKDTKPSKPNGDIKPLRRESKGFRIGSARRVTEGAPLTNGEVERVKFPPRLLAGDGDPDFGTPV